VPTLQNGVRRWINRTPKSVMN